MLTQFQSFVEQLMHRHGTRDDLTQAELLTIAENLSALCETIDWHALQLPAASRGQEVLHELAVSSPTGPSAYLISDGIGVTSPPHEHQTWAVIVGVRGKELHTKYKVVPGDSRRVEVDTSISVGAGEVLTLAASDIHSTKVFGDQPTYHVHLYGVALSSWPPFSSRCYKTESAT